MFNAIVEILIEVACVLYIVSRWVEAKNKRDSAWSLRPAAGVIINEKKPAIFWYLFK